MHDLPTFRNNFDRIAERLATRSNPPALDQFRELDRQRRTAISTVEQLKARRNTASQEIAALKKSKQDATSQIDAMKKVGDEIKDLDARLAWQPVRAKLLARDGEHDRAERMARDVVAAAQGTDALNKRARVLLDHAEVLRLGGRVTSTFGPSRWRSATIAFWSDVRAVRGGFSPHNLSTRTSVETTSFARRRSAASTARCRCPPSCSGSPSAASTSNGPRIRNSSTRTL